MLSNLNIDWSKLTKPRLVLNSIKSADKKLQASLYLTTFLLLISVFTLSISSYFNLTKQIGTVGGILRDSVVGGDLSLFNPVLDRTNSTTKKLDNYGEQKINSLLYAPLYEIDDIQNVTGDLSITPVLLSKAPEWQDLDQVVGQKYKKALFTLRDNIYWSDGSKITTRDIQYTFDRLAEDAPAGNSAFYNLVKNLTLTVLDDQKFFISSDSPKPYLFSEFNIQPISASYYAGLNNASLLATPKSVTPAVTSGYFTMSDKIQDPDSKSKQTVTNPIREDNKIRKVVLTSNKYNNYNNRTVFPATYVLTYYDTMYNITAESGNALKSLVNDSTQGKVDLYQVNFVDSLDFDTSKFASTMKMDKQILDTTDYLSLYFNIRKGDNGYLINQSLRKYITCNLLNYNDNTISNKLNSIASDKKVLPLELQTSFTPECPANLTDILDPVYNVKTDDTTKQKRITISTNPDPIQLTIIGYGDRYQQILNNLAAYFDQTIGIPLTIVSADAAVINSLDNKEYHFALLPHSLVNSNLYNQFSPSAANLSSLPNNDRIAQYQVNSNLNTFYNSMGQDENAKTNLVDFFSKEFVVFNLYQSKYQVNYSSKIINISTNLPKMIASNLSIYKYLPNWFLETRRVLK